MRPILWGRGSSSNVQKVIWAAQELNLDYDHRIVGGQHGGTETEEYLRLNPNRKVPVWQDEAVTLWESHAILRHLARSAGRLYGSTLADQAHVDKWLDWTHLVFWPPVRLLFQEFHRPGRPIDGDSRADEAIAAANDSIMLADGAMSDSGFMAGDEFSIADIALGIALNRCVAMEFGIELPQRLGVWREMASARPAFSVAITDEPTSKGS